MRQLLRRLLCGPLAPTQASVPHYRDPTVSWWKHPCDGGLAIIVEVGRSPIRRGEGHIPLRTFIEPDDAGSEIEKLADDLKQLGPSRFRELVESGALVRIG